MLLISASGLLVYLVAMPYAHIILRFALKLSSPPFAPVIRILRRVCLALTTGTPQPPQNSLPIAVVIPPSLKQIAAFQRVSSASDLTSGSSWDRPGTRTLVYLTIIRKCISVGHTYFYAHATQASVACGSSPTSTIPNTVRAQQSRTDHISI